MAELAERIFVQAVRAELDRVNDPQVRIAAHLADQALKIDADGLAEFALELERRYRVVEQRINRERHGPLPEPTSGVSRG